MTFEEIRKKLLEEDAASQEKIASGSASTPQAQFAELRRQLKTPTTETTGAASKELPQYAKDFIKSIYPDPQPKDDYETRLGALEQELTAEWLKKEQAAEHRYTIGSPMQMTTPYAPAQSPSAGAGGAYQIGSPTASTSPYQPKEQTQAATKPSESDTRIAELEQAISDLKAEHDRQIYESDLQQISAMPEEQRSAMEAVAKGAGKPTDVQQFMAYSNGRKALLAAGYTEEQIGNLAESYARYLNAEAAQQRQTETQAKVDKSWLSALGQNLLAFPANLAGGVTGTVGAVGEGMTQMLAGSRYESLDPNLESYKLSQYAQDVRSATRENIEDGNGLLGKAGGTLYGAATSAVDNLARIVVAGPTGSLALAGASSFQDSVRDVSMRGGSAAQAFGMGVATAALEILTEKVSLDALIETPSPSSVKQLLKNAAIQGGVEVSEEELNFAASTIADAIIMGDKSNIRREYNALIADGKSHADAVNAVMGGLLESAVNTAAESFLSGGMMSGATGTAQYLANRKSGKGGSTGEAQPQTPAAEAQEAAPAPQAAQSDEKAENAGGSTPAINAAESTVENALRAFRENGSVSNSTASRILNTAGAVEYLQQNVEFQLPGTASGNRAAVKYALEMMAAESTVDTQPQPGYDNNTATQKGANTYGRQGEMGDSGVQWNPQVNPQGKTAGSTADGGGNENISGQSRSHGTVRAGKLYTSDSEGRSISPEISSRLTETVVVDSGGNPVAVYHATDNMEFTTFAKGDTGFHFGTKQQTEKLRKDRQYTNGRTFRAYLNIKNPFRADMDIMGWKAHGTSLLLWGRGVLTDTEYQQIQALTPEGLDYDSPASVRLREILESKGYDGIAYPNGFEGDGYSYMVFHDDQIIRSEIQNFSNESSGAIVGDDDHIVPPDNSSIPKETESVGAAPHGFDAYSDLQYRYGNQPDRANDARPVNVPVRDSQGKKVSGFAGNAYGAEAVSDRDIKALEELIADGAFGADVQHMSDVHERQLQEIREKGMWQTKSRLLKAVQSGGKFDSADVATAQILLACYSNRNGEAAADAASDLAVCLAEMARESGRQLNMFKLLRKLTPQGQLMAVQKNVQQYVDAVNKRRTKKHQAEVTIPEELLEDYMSAAQEDAATPTEESRKRKEDAEQAIYKAAAAQIKATHMEKWNAWRRMAMLFNPKTQLRNFFGNVAFSPFVDAKRAVGAAFERVFIPQEQRTKSVLGVGENAQKLLALAKQDAAAQQNRMDGSARTGDDMHQIDDYRQIFNNKLLEKGRTGLMDFMEATDMIFKRREYSLSLASFLKARGYTAAQWEAGKVPESVLEEGRAYAAQEAMKATFNDRNKVSELVCKMRFKGNDGVSVVANALVEGLLPFRRTPANVAVRAMEYSPAGLVKAISTDAVKLKNKEITAAEYIDHLSAGLTGTGAAAMGAALASGIFGVRLVGALDDEDEKRMGHQAYAIEIGNQSFTIDWLAPSNIPLFVGANLYSAMEQAGEEDVSALTAFLYAAGHTLEPMLELSCLSSVNDLLQDVRYAEEGTELYAIASSLATSYFLQGLPTIFSQWDTAANANRKTVYQESSDPVIAEAQRLLGRAFQKLPGDPYQTTYVDAWGRTEDDNPAVRIAESLLSPFYSSTVNRNTVDMELQRLNRVQDENVSPSAPQKTLTVDGEKRRLTGKEWTALAKEQGQLQHKLVSAIINSKGYDSLSDEQKAKAIEDAYTYAKEKARQDIISGADGFTAKWMEEVKPVVSTVAQTIIERRMDKEAQPKTGLTETQYAKAKEAGLAEDLMTYVGGLLSGLTPEQGKDRVSLPQQMEAITGSTMTEGEKEDWLYWLLSDKQDAKFDAAKELGFDAEDYAVAYRLYRTEEDIGGKGTKARTVAGLMEKFDISEETARALYEIYDGSYDD